MNGRALVAAALSVAWLGLAARAEASASPPRDPGPQVVPGVQVVGRAVIDELRVEVRCTDEPELSVCRLRASFAVHAGEAEVVLGALAHDGYGWRDGGPDREIRVDGEPFQGAITLAPGAISHVEIDATRQLVITTERDEPLVIWPMRARHPLLGESTAGLQRSGQSFVAPIVDGNELAFAGSVHVDAPAAGPVRVSLGARAIAGEADASASDPGFRPDLTCARAPEPVRDTWIGSGGPVLAIGARWDDADVDEARFFLRVGYELALAEIVFGSIAIETDFDSIMESAVIEVASPEVLAIFPSLSAGIGAVARQLGQRDADAALRVRIAAQLPYVGLSGDLDYWPAVGIWSATLAVRGSV